MAHRMLLEVRSQSKQPGEGTVSYALQFVRKSTCWRASALCRHGKRHMADNRIKEVAGERAIKAADNCSCPVVVEPVIVPVQS